MSWRERFSSFLNRGKKPKADGQVVIDTDVFPGIGHHLDVSSYGPDGKLQFHGTFSPNATPETIASGLNQLADDFLKNPPASMSPEELKAAVELLRTESKKIQ